MGKDADHVVVSRKELYDLVWTQPVIKIAKDVGVSDVAVAKACRRHEIPLPGRGYWRLVEVGQCVERKPLPKVEYEEHITFTRCPESCLPASEASRAERLAKNRVTVPEEPDELHPLSRQALITLSQAEPDERGLLVSQGTLDIKVSPKQLSRAIRIMDSLVKALEARGHKVEVTFDDEKKRDRRYETPRKDGTYATIQRVSFPFGIEECADRAPHIPTKREERELAKGHRWNVPEHDYLPNGCLQLKIKDSFLWGLRGHWSDGKKQRLEDLLNNFIAGLITAAEAVNERERERERERQRQMEEARRHHEEEQRRQEEEKRVDRLKDELRRWRQAGEIREYAGLLAQAAGADPDSSVHRWIEWIRTYADRLDPLKSRAEG